MWDRLRAANSTRLGNAVAGALLLLLLLLLLHNLWR
jgi:hypothetical protein